MARSKNSPTPAPGRAVRGSTSGRSVMALFDLLGRRWALRILWELRSGPLTFRALRAKLDDVSPSVLNARLSDLRETAIVERCDDGYVMTDLGRELAASLMPLVEWSKRWERYLQKGKR